MKALSTIAAGMLVAFLALTPLVSTVAAATVTVSVNPTSAQGVVAMSITGTVSPVPSGQVAAVKVLNPSGTIVAQGQPTVDSTTGGFSYSFSTGGTANWKSGTYTVTAVVGSDTATPATFVYACAEAICGASGGVQTGATTAINVQVTAETPVWPGQEITISVLTFSAANG